MQRSIVVVAAGLCLCGCATGRAGSTDDMPDAEWARVRWETETGFRGSYALLAPDDSVRGLVLLVGAPGDAGLPVLLRQRGIATVQPDIRPWTMFLRREEIEGLGAVVDHAAGRLGVPSISVVAGGISLGGTGAVRYTEECLIRGCGRAAPAAVFAVDAPLDMRRLWDATNTMAAWGAEEGNLPEAVVVLERLAVALGGPPSAAPAAYLGSSAFAYTDRRGGNARVLVDTPVRLYIEPDMDYWIGERRYDYYTINAFDAAAMVNRLLILGNTRAELIVTSGKGYRPDGTRNPHSWSIVDEPELADWIVRQLR